MLKPLGTSISTWTPAGRVRGDGFSEIVALWPHIVGVGMAARTRPLERQGDQLLIAVPSSTWSHQLSLLGSDITAALETNGIRGIARLRFRVTRERRVPSEHGAGRSRPSGGAGQAREPAPTLAGAFERLQSTMAQARDAKLASGWKLCLGCGVALPDGVRCAPCSASDETKRADALAKLLYEAPWLGYAGTSALVPNLSPSEYGRVRLALLSRWWERLGAALRAGRLQPGGLERRIASSYVLLKTGFEPERITPEVVRNELTAPLHDLLYGKHEERTLG